MFNSAHRTLGRLQNILSDSLDRSHKVIELQSKPEERESFK